MEYISNRLLEPLDRKAILSWNRLSTRNQNTLRRAIERSVTWEAEHFQGFNYDLMTKISIRDLHDARFIGPARAEDLIQELVSIFNEIKDEKFDTSPHKSMTLASKLISTTSLQILAKLSVDDNLEKYLERIGSFALLTTKMRHTLLQELQPNKNPFKRIMFGKRERDIALGQLIDANLRLSFALAKRVCLDRDVRARTVAGNYGLLSGITSFSDKPNVDFESHLMKYIREFIEELVGLLNFSHDDIVALMLETNGVEAEENITKEVISAVVPFESCTTFSEIYEELDIELLKLPKVDERALKMLKHRHQAFREQKLTLDEIGKEWGITRERVRQIVDPLMKVNIQIQSELPILNEAVELFMECEDEEDFKSRFVEHSIFEGDDISWERLWGLSQILSADSLAPKVYEKHKQWERSYGSNSTIRTSIKSYRSKFGLYDLKVVCKKYEIDEARAFKVISETYPRSIRCGSLVLARTKNLDTSFESSIAKQLKVTSPIGIQELLKGLERTGRQRDTTLIGSTIDLSNLIVALAGNPPNYLKASSGLIKEVEFQTLEKWLIEVFSEANLGILHSTDVINFALRDRRVNVNSVSIYLLNSPIIRSHGRAMYSLVGTDVTKSQLDSYIQIIRGTSVSSEVSYEMQDASKGILYVIPNLNTITSGIVFPPLGYKNIFEGFEFTSVCSCENLQTMQAVKFAPSGFWTGFTAMIRHGFSHHQMGKGSTFRFEFDFDKSVVKLIVD